MRRAPSGLPGTRYGTRPPSFVPTRKLCWRTKRPGPSRSVRSTARATGGAPGTGGAAGAGGFTGSGGTRVAAERAKARAGRCPAAPGVAARPREEPRPGAAARCPVGERHCSRLHALPCSSRYARRGGALRVRNEEAHSRGGRTETASVQRPDANRKTLASVQRSGVNWKTTSDRRTRPSLSRATRSTSTGSERTASVRARSSWMRLLRREISSSTSLRSLSRRERRAVPPVEMRSHGVPSAPRPSTTSGRTR